MPTIISCPLILLYREKGRRDVMIWLRRDVMVWLLDVMMRQRDSWKSANVKGRPKRHMALYKTPVDGGPKRVHWPPLDGLIVAHILL